MPQRSRGRVVFGERIGHFPVRQRSALDVREELVGNLTKMSFVADLVGLRNGDLPSSPEGRHLARRFVLFACRDFWHLSALSVARDSVT